MVIQLYYTTKVYCLYCKISFDRHYSKDMMDYVSVYKMLLYTVLNAVIGILFMNWTTVIIVETCFVHSVSKNMKQNA